MDPAELCAAIGPRLVGSLTLFCGDRALAEELAQEALARAYERWPRVSTMESPAAWTYRVAFNLARSAARRRAAERRASRRLATELQLPLPDAAAAIAVREAVLALPPRQRAAIVARYFGQLSVAESAAALGCAEGTVRALTAQAVAALRRSGLIDVDEEVTTDAEPR